MVRRVRLLLIVCCGSPALVQMVPKTLRGSAERSPPGMSQQSFDPAVLSVIGPKAYHTNHPQITQIFECNLRNLWIAFTRTARRAMGRFSLRVSRVSNTPTAIRQPAIARL